jgi:hypothetical protein
VEVPIDGKMYVIRLREGQFVADIARQFCIEEQASLGYNEANPLTTANIASCVTPISTYLQNAVQQYNQQQQPAAAAAAGAGAQADANVAVQVTIGQNRFEIRFQPQTESVKDVASNFCVQQAEVIGVTRETYDNCVTQVGQYLANALAGK